MAVERIFDLYIPSRRLQNGVTYDLRSLEPIESIEIIPEDVESSLVGNLTFTKGQYSVVMDLSAQGYYQSVAGCNQLLLVAQDIDPAKPFCINLHSDRRG